MHNDDYIAKREEALVYISHGDYESAIDIFTEILQELDKNTIEYNEVLLEYALALLENISLQTEESYKTILSGSKCAKLDMHDDDIEVAWECLENCRINFEVVKDSEKLCLVHKGLGDVQSLNNHFEEAVKEYLKAVDYCADDELHIELLECIAESHKNNNNLEEAVEWYGQVRSIYMKKGDEEEAACISELIAGLEMLKFTVPMNKKEEGGAKDNKPLDVNHLKKAND
ncbi:hypothetical protein ENBRE01_0642 [Enteropsectra breve]|nr:hypothetical protein ENBRE01_0642 [Enteropsectra breve]